MAEDALNLVLSAAEKNRIGRRLEESLHPTTRVGLEMKQDYVLQC